MEQGQTQKHETETKSEEISNDAMGEEDESSSLLTQKEVCEDAECGSAVSEPVDFVGKLAVEEKANECSLLLEAEASGKDRAEESLMSPSTPDEKHDDRSCVEVDPPMARVPEVHVSISNGPKLNSRSDQENVESHTRHTDCVPLNALFNSDAASPSQHRWGDELGYKNWLVHLGRRRRCTILILVGFLLWLAFFLVLAIALNQNRGKADGMEGNGKNQWGSSRVQTTLENLSTAVSKDILITKPGVPNLQENKILSPTSDKGNMFTSAPRFKPGMIDHATTEEKILTTTKVPVDGKADIAIKTVIDKLPEASSKPLKPRHEEVETTSTVSKASIKQYSGAMGNISVALPDSLTTPPSQSSDVNFKAEKYPEVSTPISTMSQSSYKNLNEDSYLQDTIKVPDVTSTVAHTSTVSTTRAEGTAPNEMKSNYVIGIGRADITGPAADVNMMGYANPSQNSGGIHLRQFSRAFIIEDPLTKVRTVFVNIDACMSSTLLKLEVLKVLKKEFGGVYTAENLCISGTHTHSTPAGFLQDVLFQISSWGYVDETLSTMVNGIVKSVEKAHENMTPGYILMNQGELVGSNINRSPTAYDNNPSEEKAKYKHNVDTEMTLLKFMNARNEAIGMINWFPVHCTSMNNTNRLISSDNKGYAELLFEKYMTPNHLPGTGGFVAAFAQSNEGDVSPNTRGPHCISTGEPCDNFHSTCNGDSHDCVASGPGGDMFESTKIIGENQFEKAKELFESALVQLQGPVKFVHQYVDMTKYEVVLNETAKVQTCKPAMGFSFAAGTTDGPGQFDFKQGDKSGNKFWSVIRNFLHPPSTEQAECHAPKPILLDTGEMTTPYEWQPEVVDTQIFQFGQFVMIAVPGEFSTMAGRRLRDTVLEVYRKSNPEIGYEAVIAGLANAYSDYIATFEEYQIQRYEGASTIYGPHTAKAYDQQYEKLAKSLISNTTVKSTAVPPNNKDKLYSFLTGVIFDRAPMFRSFGDVQDDVAKYYSPGDLVSVRFVAANPRNCLQLQHENMTFLTVERKTESGSWEVIHTDADWETKFIWVRVSTVTATSDVTVIWATDKTTEPGQYIIHNYGCAKPLLGAIYTYSGKSSEFTIKGSE